MNQNFNQKHWESNWWDPKKCLNAFNRARNLEEKKKVLSFVAKNNRSLLKYLKQCGYQHKIPYTFGYNASMLNRVYKYLENLPKKKGNIIIEQFDTHKAIIKYTKCGHKIIVNNYANPSSPGGGYKNGALTQEEELCRRSPHFYASIDKANFKNFNGKRKAYQVYPLYDRVGITHQVPLCRGSREDGYPIYFKPNINFGVISTAAPNMNRRRNLNRSFDDLQNRISNMIKLMLTIPQYKNKENYNCFIGGAIGCGAFAPSKEYPIKRQNYIKKMATVMVQYVNKHRYLYDIIVIAVPRGYNYDVFANAFREIAVIN